MTKLEFANKLEIYLKKQNKDKVIYFILGLVFIIFTFIPQVALFFSESMFGFTSAAFSVFGGLCLGKAWHLKSGTEEHELLINAMDLLSSSKDT